MVAFMAGLALGFWVQGKSSPSAEKGGVAMVGAGEGGEAVAGEIAAIEQDLANTGEGEEELTSRMRKISASVPDLHAVAVAEKNSFVAAGKVAAMLGSIDEADGLAQEFLLIGDLEGLWLLGADLINQGEEGFEKLIELSAWLEEDQESFRDTKLLWRHEEQVAGRFLRCFEENHEAVLRFGLYLATKKPRELPSLLREFHEELQDEMGVVLLGYYGGNDPAIYNGYLQLFRQGLADPSSRHSRDRIRAVGQIPTEEATTLLIELLDRVPPATAQEVVRSLAWQGSERALPALRTLQQSATDERLLAVVEAAIRYLE